MYEVREAHDNFVTAQGDFIAVHPESVWLVVFDDNVGTPDVIARCWTQANAQAIAAALNA